MRLWSLKTSAVDRTWQAFLRRFDLEYTFRLKQTLAETDPGCGDQKRRIVRRG